jgi:hypothetical protein
MIKGLVNPFSVLSCLVCIVYTFSVFSCLLHLDRVKIVLAHAQTVFRGVSRMNDFILAIFSTLCWCSPCQFAMASTKIKCVLACNEIYEAKNRKCPGKAY